MINFDKTFTYPTLERIDSPTGRKYITPEGEALPSVTTILSATKSEESKKALEGWAKRLGQKEADNVKNTAAAIGTIIHNQLEKYMLGEELKWGNNLIQKVAKKMVDTVIEHGISKITKVYGLETPLFYSGLYAGSADLIIEIDGKIVIGDFKNSLKIKKEEYLSDYYCQLCAYGLAFNNMFGTKINSGIIMMVARPNETTGICEYKEFNLDPDKFSKFEDLWYSRLEQFYSQNK